MPLPFCERLKRPPKQISDIGIFDVYEGEEIGQGKKSLQSKLTYSSNATFTEAELQKISNDIIKSVKNSIQQHAWTRFFHFGSLFIFYFS